MGLRESWLTFCFWTEPDLLISRRRVYPAVGLQSKGAGVRANFGVQAFQYNAVGDGGWESDSVKGFEELEIL